MTVFYYIISAMLLTIFFTGAAFVVFRTGEKELICKYGQEDDKQ